MFSRLISLIKVFNIDIASHVFGEHTFSYIVFVDLVLCLTKIFVKLF